MSPTATAATPASDYRSAPDNTDLGHIPGSFGLPILGHNIALYRDFYGLIDQQYKKYGPVSRLGLAGQKGLLLVGPDLYQQIYLDKERNFSTEMGYDRSLGRFYKGALLLRDGDEHKFQRRLMQTAFKNDAMRGYLDHMAPILRAAIATWPAQPEFHFVPAIKQALLDVAALIFVGLDELDEQAEILNKAFLDVAKGLEALIIAEIPGTLYKKGKDGERILHKFFGDLIDQRRVGDGIDTFSHFCREKDPDGEFFSDEEIIRHMTFLLFAAHDTTTSALSHLFMYLARYPEWQQRLREEVEGLGTDRLQYEHLEQMPLTDAAVRESLRLHPSVQVMQRRTIRECELGGHRVPANTLLFIMPEYVHRMEEYWTNPMQFDPERWLEPRNEHKNHSFNFVGFGGGAHKCIGMHFALMQSKCFVHEFLTRYECSTPDGYAPQIAHIPLPKPADDLPMTVTRR